MVVIMKPDTDKSVIFELEQELLVKYDLKTIVNEGIDCTVLGLVGDTSVIDEDIIKLNPNVERVMRVQEPYKKASRKFHPDSTIVQVGETCIGGEKISVIAGPCSVESKSQITEVAKSVKNSGASLLRGGAYKPRSSPYAFQGMELEGLDLLRKAKEETGLPIVTEIMSPKLVEVFEHYVDIIQIGARNMQNFDLLKELGKTTKPILLKRGLSSTIEEWLMSAEYIMAGGNPNVILCERGIRTFETYTRNTLDISAIPAVKRLSHLPVIVDPSHASGMNFMVAPLSMAAIAAGADGLIIEVHNDPQHAKCDGPQSINPLQFNGLMGQLSEIAKQVGRSI